MPNSPLHVWKAYLGRLISHTMRRRERRKIIEISITIETVNTGIAYHVPNAVLSSLQILVHLTLQQHYQITTSILQMRKRRPERLFDWPTSALPGGVRVDWLLAPSLCCFW